MDTNMICHTPCMKLRASWSPWILTQFMAGVGHPSTKAEIGKITAEVP